MLLPRSWLAAVGIMLIEDAIKAIVDLKLHSSWVPGGRDTPDDVYERTYRELAVRARA
jgi:hypothetical protein